MAAIDRITLFASRRRGETLNHTVTDRLVRLPIHYLFRLFHVCFYSCNTFIMCPVTHSLQKLVSSV